jgi:uncharacterized protein YfaS (alpha-2-macroglobulin family)
VPASGYRSQSGVPFFILSDRSYGSDEIAQLRLETTRDGSGALLSGDSGVDLAVYRIAKPLDFLRAQRNLHRVASKAIHVGDGAGQTLNYLYDSWTKQTRRSWQRILSTPARQAATQRYPGLSMGDYPGQPTRFAQDIQFKPIAGMRLETRLRYPMWAAKPIAPPKDLKLEGSSSDFIQANPGNVMIPLGKLKPGLYLVEAMFGSHRANSLLFVSDSVAVTKTAGEQMLVWAAQRRGGAPVANAEVVWTDGVGVLGSGQTDASGVLAMRRASPEKSYVAGVDPQGGVFVSENFYYDSEIYNAKIYAVTDRPLYRPGDTVRVKFIGRQFRDARRSEPLADATLKLRVNDPNGSPLLGKDVAFSGRDGGDVQFTLPANAPAGGWELRFDLGEDRYGAAFRVAEYVKPHFDIHVDFGRANIKSGEAIAGRIKLAYPNGKPVRRGSVSMSVRAQRVTMVEGELNYAGLFPVALEQIDMTTDDNGVAPFTLPAAAQPSRYIVTVLANDGAAYRVKVTRELLIERGANPWRVSAPRRFSPPGESVAFRLQGEGTLVGATWEVVRLESRTRTQGTLKDGADRLGVAFEHPGSYAINLRDAQGNLLGAANHWVTGKGVKTAPGSIEIVTDKERYAPGETADVLITFSDATEHALVTLERDAVERHALLGKPADWIAEATRVADNQWRLKIPIGEAMAPNVALSVSRVKAGEHVFQNAGLVVAQPTLDIAVRADKETYRPGDTARLDFTGTFQGKPVEALLNVAVVDEMVYVLQPELAPSIVDFFYHLRRNNVRTGSSLAFIGYDLARDYADAGARRQTRNERAVKVLERPRRDEVDTAAWFPSLRTDKNGRASVTFKIPDSLTRWRITARGLAADGQAGQRTAYIRSEKPLYLKWTGPRQFRDGDEPIVDLVGFNRGDKPVAATLRTAFGANSTQRQVTLNPGPNYFTLPLLSAHRGVLKLELLSGGKSLDSLEVNLASRPVAWPSARQINTRLLTATTDISLPADAGDIQLSLLGGGTEYFAQVVDDLIDYPYGCVEQTSSRLIPLALAHQVLGKTRGAERLGQLLQAQRARLVRLAGGDGVFGWWGRASSDSAFLTGYAYYADSFAARALSIQLPTGHAENLLKVYSQHADKEPILHRALVLWWAQRLGLPVQGLAQGLAEHLTSLGEGGAMQLRESDSLVFATPDSRLGRLVAAVLLDAVAKQGGFKLGAGAQKRAAEARQALAGVAQPFVQALLRLGDNKAPAWTPDMLLYRVGAEAPTFERAMTLAWVHESLGGFGDKGNVGNLQPLGWVPGVGDLGNARWLWSAAKPPTRVSLARPPQTPVTAALRYTSHATETPRLAIAVQRRLYRLAPDAASLTFQAVPVAANEALSPNALYVDEVSLVPKAGQRFRYGMLEVPLPPGAGIEGTTWGIRVEGLGTGEDAAALSAPEHEMGEMHYRVAVDNLDKPLVTRQLLRFQQRGRFNLPPARFFRMYQPGDKALESQGAALWRVE